MMRAHARLASLGRRNAGAARGRVESGEGVRARLPHRDEGSSRWLRRVHGSVHSFRTGRDAARENTRKEGCGHMTIDQATELIRHTLVLALIVSAPMLIIGLGVGIVVSLLQAVTQIQEQTLTFIPKITAMFAAAILLLPWIGHRLIEYTSAMLLNGQIP